MPYKESFWAAFAAFYNKFSEPINLLLIITLSAVGRALYTGNKGKAVFGDLIICYVIVSVISPHIPPVVFGLQVNELDIAACVGIVGVHGMKQILAYAVKRRTGIDFLNKEKDKE
ncbi:hypothetical protein [Rahnella aceris]|uniref:hypothetical protein n=1 Tax=Rahnella sp. (strain Y9602) TaxID=2703885 RepID=UPI001C26B5C6|nr:hypothetical protein [Rahnella aceris]MBU9866802.1 hypothetical protein [Rahnella aceris]